MLVIKPLERHVTPRDSGKRGAGFLDEPLDLIKTFGPMSAMHAVMDKLGVGMPCGLVARLQKKSAPEVEAAIETARHHFPLLQGRIAWRDSRPVLVATNHAQILPHTLGVSSAFESDPDGGLWRYRVIEDGEDTWLIAVWAHAVADGPSMLRFLETIGATTTDAPIPELQRRPRDRARRRNIVRWLARFMYERYLPYLAPATQTLHPAGVAWLTIPSGRSALLLKNAKAECDSFAAWLAGAACIAFCAQQGVTAGRISLNLPIQRDNLAGVGGFGFGVGSLLMPVKLGPSATLPLVAHGIGRRMRAMAEQGWHENFERFLGGHPKRHLRFARLYARGASRPIISVSWKGADWRLGGQDGIRDVTCFAASPVAHVSGHIDQNGLSLSLTSNQSTAARVDLLQRIADVLGCGPVTRVLTFDGHTPHVIQTTGAPSVVSPDSWDVSGDLNTQFGSETDQIGFEVGQPRNGV